MISVNRNNGFTTNATILVLQENASTVNRENPPNQNVQRAVPSQPPEANEQNQPSLNNYSKSTTQEKFDKEVPENIISLNNTNYIDNGLYTLKIKVTDVGLHKYSSVKFSFVMCRRVTTLWIDNLKITYLTSPFSTNEFYFIKLFEYQFNTDKIKETLSVEPFDGKIPRNVINSFFNELLNVLEYKLNAQKNFKKIKNKKTMFYFCNLINSFVFILGLITTFIFYFVGQVELLPSILILTTTLLTFIFCCFGWLCYNINYEDFLYRMSKFLISSNTDVLRLLEEWNHKVFFHYNMYVSCPLTLNYIMICLDKRYRLVVHHHLYPYEVHFQKNKSKFAKKLKQGKFCSNLYCTKYREVIPCYRMNCSYPGSVCTTKDCPHETEMPHHYHHCHIENINLSSEALFNNNNHN